MFGSPAKTDELIEMLFGVWTLDTRVDPWNHALDGGPDRPIPRENFWGKGHCPGMPDDSAMSCAKMAEPMIEMSFGLWTQLYEPKAE